MFQDCCLMRFGFTPFVLAVLFAGIPSYAVPEDVHNVRDFGALGDGQALDTQSIQNAINASAEKGGGAVYFPPGTYLSGTIYLKSNVNLQFERGASLLGTKDLTRYLQPASPDHYIYGTSGKHLFLYGEHVENVKLEGQGVIDGNWATYIDPVTKKECRGPAAVFFVHSKNITLDTVAVTRSPGWAITFFDCQNVQLLGVKVIHCKCDGINPVNCQDVLYDGVYIDGTGDDPITIKNEGTLDKPHATRNITIRNTTVRNTSHPGVKIGTGTAGTFQNITVENCFFDIRGDFFTIQLMRPSLPQNPERFIDNIRVKNITVKNAGRFFDITTMGVSTPVIRNLHFENIQFAGTAADSRIIGLPDSPIENITLKNITVAARCSGPVFLHTQYVSNLHLENIELNGSPIDSFLTAESGAGLSASALASQTLTAAAPAIHLREFQNASFTKLNFPASKNLIFVSGESSKTIALQSGPDLSNPIPLLASQEVPADTIKPLAGKVAIEKWSIPDSIPAGQPFNAELTLQNTGAPGAYKIQVFLDDQCLGQQWLWLSANDSQTLSIPCTPVYIPGEYQPRVNSLSCKITVQKTPADVRYGEFCEVDIPAVMDKPVIFFVPIGNFGGTSESKTVELKRDSQIIASQTVVLQPGEQTKIRLECTVPDDAPHCWQIGDFPEWAWATFRNVPAKIFLGRNCIRIEAAGRRNYEELAALYWRAVPGDFDLTVQAVSQTETTGERAAIGLIVRNTIADPQSRGFTLFHRTPKYGNYYGWLLDLDGDGVFDAIPNGGGPHPPCWFQLQKRGQTFQTFVSMDGTTWEPFSNPFTIPSAAPAQDVGIYANAYGDGAQTAVSVFSHLTLTRIKP